jgi:hypothetical protein
VFVTVNHFHPSKNFDRLLTLHKNIRVAWKGLQGKNTLAYWVHL